MDNFLSDKTFKNFDRKDIQIFAKDLLLTFTILKSLDNEYARSSNSKVSKDIKKFEALIKDWNLKYRDIVFEFRVKDMQCGLKVFFLDNMIKIRNLMQNMDGYLRMSKFKGKTEAFFSDYNRKENTLTIREEKDWLRLIYSEEDMLDPHSPEFRVCTFYAMLEGFDKSVDIIKYENEFSFAYNLSKDNWFKRYPKMESFFVK